MSGEYFENKRKWLHFESFYFLPAKHRKAKVVGNEEKAKRSILSTIVVNGCSET